MNNYLTTLTRNNNNDNNSIIINIIIINIIIIMNYSSILNVFISIIKFNIIKKYDKNDYYNFLLTFRNV